MKTRNILLITILLFCSYALHSQDDMDANGVLIEAQLSGAAFVTHDIESSVKFYKDFLGFKEYKRMYLSTPTGLAPFGINKEQKLLYVALVPAVWSKENPNFPGLNFVEILDAKESPLKQDKERKPVVGEILKAYAVKGLTEISKQMVAANIPIVTPLALSITGKSMTLTVIDPNGVRVQMYEYVKKE